MQRRVCSLVIAALFAGPVLPAAADATLDDLESMSLGDPHQQNGWSSVGTGTTRGGSYDYDHYIVDPAAYPTGPASFGSRALRMSNARIQNSFGEQVFSPALVDEAGESDAVSGGFSGGTRQRSFRLRFDVVSTTLTQQPGMSINVSPDRGDGARMSSLTIVDGTLGLDVSFSAYTSPSTTCGTASFTSRTIASGLDRSLPHTVLIELDAQEGAFNDVVTISIDGSVVATGGSWEDYYRCNQAPGSRTVDSILIRSTGTETPTNRGNGFLLDNFYVASGPPSTSTGVVWCVPNITIDASCEGARSTIAGAIDAAHADDLILLSGTYTLTSSILLAKDDLTIRSVSGDGRTATAGATLQLTGASPPGDGILRVTGNRNTIEGLRFEDESDRPGGPDPDHVTLKLEGDDNLVTASRFAVPLVFRTGETCAGGDFGIQIRGEAGSDGIAAGNTIHGNVFDGGCRAIGAVYSGETRRASDTTISHNVITGSGIANDGAGAMTIVGNTLTASTPMASSGVYCRAKDSPTGAEPNHSVSGTRIEDNTFSGYAWGAYFQGCGGVVSTGNTYADGDIGVSVTAEGANTGGPSFTRDRFEGNLTSGLRNVTGVDVIAERSWWGHESGPSGAGGGTGDAVSVDVSYAPWYLDRDLTTLAAFDALVDCDARTNDVAAIQAVIDEMHSGGSLALQGICELASVGPYTTDPASVGSTRIDAAAIAIGAGSPDVTITSFDLAAPATLLGSGTQAGIFVGPGAVRTTITGLRFVNLARPVVVHNATDVRVGSDAALLSPFGNRFIGGATMDAAVLGIGAVNGASISVGIGASATPRSFATPSGQRLTGLQVLGNVMRIDPPGARAHGVDIRQRDAGTVDGVLVEANSIGMGGSEFPSFTQAAVHVWAHAGDANCHVSNVEIDGNNLGRFEELAAVGLADLQTAGRTGVILHNVCSYRITDNGIRTRVSPTVGIDMPGGGIVVDNSRDGVIAGGSILALDDESTRGANLGAIAVIRGLDRFFGGSGAGLASERATITNLVIGSIEDGAPAPLQGLGVVVNGSSRVSVSDVEFESVQDRAINIGRVMRGPLAMMPAEGVHQSVFCANSVTPFNGAERALVASDVRVLAGISSSGNRFPGGQLLAANSGC